MKDLLRTLLENTFQSCHREGFLEAAVVPEFSIDVPRNKAHGDLAANLAMVLAKPERKSPREIAAQLISRIEDPDGIIEKTEIAGPGFINFYLKKTVWHDVLKKIEEQGQSFGSSSMGKGEKIIIEFVSANPTGPLHIGHGRGAAVGDAFANILSFCGYSVSREYYVNDVGNQMQNLGKSVYIRYCQLLKKDMEFPDGLYQGEYIAGIAKEIILRHGNRFLETEEKEAAGFFTEFASSYLLKGIEKDLELFGVHFDSWFSEKKLFDTSEVDETIKFFRKEGLFYEHEGALWFKASEFGDEKDRVIIKNDGKTTYFASDIAYHRDKYRRGFQKAIDIWGADHHGYIPRIRAVLKALDIPRDRFGVILVQIVSLLRDGTPVAMSTRSGQFVTLREVIEEVGKDACRFIFLTRRSDAQLDFDLSVAKKQSDENPVFYVQYAHARICSIISFAKQQGTEVPCFSTVNPGLLSMPEEFDIMKTLSRFPGVISGSASSSEPHRVATYLLELVSQFHSYYNKGRVITSEEELTAARLLLVNSVRSVLKNGMALLGVNAPKKM